MPPISSRAVNRDPFGEFVYTERARRGLTQAQLAAELGIDKAQTILTWEHGYVRPQERLVIRLARWCDRPVSEVAALIPGFKMPSDTVGGRIRAGRWTQYLNRADFADLVGTNETSVKDWETKDTLPTNGHVQSISRVLGISFDATPPSAGVLAWPGSKARYVSELLQLLPQTRTYVEPFGGSAVALLSRLPSKTEVYNDIHGDLVNLFRVLRHPEQAADLHRRLSLTLQSRAEHAHASDILRSDSSDAIERAWAYFVIINQGFQARESMSTGNWRKKARTDWWTRISWVDRWHERLAGVLIENTDALGLLGEYDSPGTTFYLDPPYVRSTRRAKHVPQYAHEVTDDYHRDLVALLLKLKGAVALAGYPHEIYVPLEEQGWERTMLGADAIWRNPRAVQLTTSAAA